LPNGFALRHQGIIFHHEAFNQSLKFSRINHMETIANV
jgi:hypothetical protein